MGAMPLPLVRRQSLFHSVYAYNHHRHCSFPIVFPFESRPRNKPQIIPSRPSNTHTHSSSPTTTKDVILGGRTG